MVSFRATLLAIAGAVTVSADYYIQPDSVPLSLRRAWCNDQRSMCKPICLDTGATGAPLDNSCDPESLTYGCVCSDGKQPNVTEYTLTLPYHVCTAWGEQCVAACGASDSNCQSECREDHPCGAQSPRTANKTQSATSSTAAATGDATAAPTDKAYDGYADGTGGEEEKGNAAGALRLGDSYGLLAVTGGLFAGFAMLL
ncbi:hypothetical protein P885DRAFT_75333 [Corynascus similis CBS 632.67]